jgi:hypothetical protein
LRRIGTISSPSLKLTHRSIYQLGLPLIGCASRSEIGRAMLTASRSQRSAKFKSSSLICGSSKLWASVRNTLACSRTVWPASLKQPKVANAQSSFTAA